MSSEHEETKEIGDVKCPECDKLIHVVKKVTYNRKSKRKKIGEELVAEAIQTQF